MTCDVLTARGSVDGRYRLHGSNDHCSVEDFFAKFLDTSKLIWLLQVVRDDSRVSSYHGVLSRA